ncbi:hypothetical protein [Catenulispora pinisilvae]|uniref:hypothetical protein n=1 Tax=Catenulispora pinisilvae TaxID=2705253 RepID=UPI00189153B1|nr:hypothetical protein [Catenulispora pinisilvae]
MMEIGLRPAADTDDAARILGAPVACRDAELGNAFVRDGEVWLSYPTPAGESWLVTAAAGSPLHRPDDLEGAAIIAASILHIGDSEPPWPPAPAWSPGGEPAVPVSGADRIVYATHGGDAVVVAAVPANAAPPPAFDWLTPTA